MILLLPLARLAVRLAFLPVIVVLRLRPRTRVRVVCFLVLGVVGYGVAQDNGWLTGPAAGATPAPHPTRPGGVAAAPPRASRAALADIPPRYLALYQRAAQQHPGLPWAVLAAIGKVESDHGRSTAPGVRSGINSFGCCAGPMQFNVRNGPPSTWAAYGHSGNPYDPADAIPAAAAKLAADGATSPAGLRQAVFAYNHDWGYVAQVLALARRYQTGGGR